MAGFVRIIFDTFWDERVWLPPNTTWKDIQPGPGKNIHYADYRHIFYPIPMAFVLLIIRYVLEK